MSSSPIARISRLASLPLVQRTMLLLIVCLVYVALSSVVTSAFFQRWGLGEDYSGANIERLMDGSAHKPWAFRVLVPGTMRTINERIPEATRANIGNRLNSISNFKDKYFEQSGKLEWSDEFSFTYHLGYAVMFTTFLAFLFLLRSLLRAIYPTETVLADMLPILVGFAVPTAYLRGGYIYDFPELMLLAASFLFAYRKSLFLLCATIVLAVLNKESNILLPFLLLPLFRHTYGSAGALRISGALLAIALIPFVIVRTHYAGNPGSGLIFQLFGNLSFWFTAEPWVAVTTVIAPLIPLPKPTNLMMIALVAGLIFLPVRRPRWISESLVVAAVLNAPLLLVFGSKDEIRNLSLIFVPLAIFVAPSVAKLYGRLLPDLAPSK